MNLAARAGRWSAAHWKTATFGWLAFVAAAVVLGSMHGTTSLTDAEQTNGEAASICWAPPTSRTSPARTCWSNRAI